MEENEIQEKINEVVGSVSNMYEKRIGSYHDQIVFFSKELSLRHAAALASDAEYQQQIAQLREEINRLNEALKQDSKPQNEK